MTTDEKILAELTEAAQRGYSPTTTYLADWVGCCVQTVHNSLHRLEQRRQVRVSRRGNRPRPVLIRVLPGGDLKIGGVSSTAQVTTRGAKHV